MLDLDKLDRETLRPISRAEFDRMVAMGMFQDERLELLHGMLVRLTPQGPPHADKTARLHTQLVLALQARAVIRGHSPFAASDDSEPEPDIAVVPEGDYTDDHPSRAFLLVEVSETSLPKDRQIKAGLYAACEVPEYWVVNLRDGLVEVYTKPEGGVFTQVESHGPQEPITLVAFPDVQIELSELLA